MKRRNRAQKFTMVCRHEFTTGDHSNVWPDAEGGATIEVLPDNEEEGEEVQEFDIGNLQGGNLSWNTSN